MDDLNISYRDILFLVFEGLTSLDLEYSYFLMSLRLLSVSLVFGLVLACPKSHIITVLSVSIKKLDGDTFRCIMPAV